MFTKALNYLNYGGITLTDNYGNSCNIPLFAITSTLYLYRRRNHSGTLCRYRSGLDAHPFQNVPEWPASALFVSSCEP